MKFSRRQWLTASVAPAIVRGVGRAQENQRPNILWLSAEDLSPDLGCYGDSYAITPNLDRLASRSVRYTNAFAVAGVCAPSRSGIVTGMYPSSIGTHHMRSKGVPPAYVKCFTEYLRAAGYYCTNNAKTDYNFDCPVTAWDENGRHAHWRNRPSGAPFFSVFNFGVTHEAQIRAEPAAMARNLAQVKSEQRHDPNKAELPPYYPDTPVVRRDWANYHDLITAMDVHVGEMLRALDADGLADNTMVFFWGDHGRGLPRAKRWIYDSGIHVPLIVRRPGGQDAGAVNEELVSLIDLGPTALSIAGVTVPEWMQGQAFLGERRKAPRRYIFASRDRMGDKYDMIRCVRDAQFKYIRNYQAEKPYAQHIDYMDEMPTMKEWRRLHAEGKLHGPQSLFVQPTKPREELYNVTRDPQEIDNLAGKPEYERTLAEMRQVHLEWMKQTRDLGLIPEAELQARWRLGGIWQQTAAPAMTPNGGSHAGPLTVRLSCATAGASIAYTTEHGRGPRWKLYTGDITLTESATLRAKAIRIGFLESPEVVAEFRV
jgi:N-sulfoglucosamine sulfohydrolase